MAKSSRAGVSRKPARASQPRNGSHRLFDDILALAATLARGRQDYGAEKLMTLAASPRDFAASLTDMPSLRAQAASAAESFEGLAEYIACTDVEQMVGRRHLRPPPSRQAINHNGIEAVSSGRWIWRHCREVYCQGQDSFW